MRKAKPTDQLTEREEELMQLLWKHGPMYVNQLVELYPEPRPHFNTVSTVIRRLEQKGFVAHTDIGGSYKYHALAKMEDFRSKGLSDFIRRYFADSYFGAVSALVQEEKLSADELRELISMIEDRK